MSIKKTVCILICLLLFSLSSCAPKLGGNNGLNSIPDQSNTDSSTSFIMRYDVYEQWATSEKPDEFSVAMSNNPISKKMESALLTQDISSTQEAQALFEGYVKIWQEELSFSINNLKKHISDEDSRKLDLAQTDWENSQKSNGEFDRAIILSSEISLGTQHAPSALLYLIDQYRDRVFHIKYMTYLVEERVSNPISTSEQTWNLFHEV